ncbi:hypothetical protein HAX54_037968 [Datura stramonium]|uniref:Uncharacterized protein n=1 Tax=Datura stramonium TaxID=4076 RepID=A0ABS8VKE2_DATST|nr:hypothetical protein [Datura stramonium]
MAKKHASSSASRSKAPVGWGAGHGTTPGGSRAGAHQTKAQTREQANPQPEVLNESQPRVATLEQRDWCLIMVDFQFLKLLHKRIHKFS